MDLRREFNSPLSDYISEDYSVQILKWLPVKTLLRFRRVCKCWKDIIDSQSFMKDHLAVQNPRLIVAYEKPDFLVLDPRTLPLVESLGSPTQDDDDEAEPFRLIGTLHGVVCVYDDYYHGDFWLWNPSVRQISILSKPKTMRMGWDEYDEFDTPPYSGFWIDPSNKNFKILVFKLDNSEKEREDGFLYSSIRKDWIAVPLDKLRGCIPVMEGPPVMVGDVAYWRSHYEGTCDEKGYMHMYMVILSFDFVKESFEIIEIADKNNNSGWCVMHCKLQGALSLVYWYEEHPDGCDVYLMQEGIWVKKFRFNLLPHISSVFWVLEEMEERRSRALASVSGALVLYDTKDDCIALKSGLRDSSNIDMSYDFVESLLFPWT